MGRELVHAGRKIRVYRDTQTAPDGTVIVRDVIDHPGAVVILPVVSASEVCLLRNTRFVVGETLWEIPAGTLEPGEDPLDAAKRELAEETGYTAATWTAKGYLFASPGVLNERLYLYFAESLTPGPQRLEADEEMTAHTLPLAEAVAMCLDGRVRDCKTVTALLMWERLGRG